MLLRLLLDATPDLPGSWLVNPGGITVAGFLMFALLAFWKRWIVTGAEHQALQAKYDALQAKNDEDLAAFKEEMEESRKWYRESERVRQSAEKGGGQ